MAEAIAFAAIGLVAALIAWLPWMRGALNNRMFAVQIEKLARAGNLERAGKLARAAPNAPFARATAIAVEALHGAPADHAEAIALVRGRFRASITTQVAQATRGWIPAGVAVAGIALSIGFAASDPRALPPIAGISGVASLLLLHATMLMRRLARDAVDAGDHMVEALVTSRATPGSRA